MFVQCFHGPMLTSRLRPEDDAEPDVLGTAEHREFVLAVQQRDVAAAQRIMSAHLAHT